MTCTCNPSWKAEMLRRSPLREYGKRGMHHTYGCEMMITNREAEIAVNRIEELEQEVAMLRAQLVPEQRREAHSHGDLRHEHFTAGDHDHAVSR